MVIVMILIVFSLVLVLFLKNGDGNPMDGDIERSSTYEVTQDGATILAFNSVPKEIVNALKEYIKNNGYNGKDIMFVFQNSKYTYNSNYSLQRDNAPFLYYVAQTKRNTGKIDYQYNNHSIFVGTMVIDESGNIVESQNLMTVDELSKIQTEPNISFNEALQTAREYLCADENTPAEIWAWCFCTPKNNDEWVLCYKIKFEGNDRIVYVDGITGEIIE